MRRFPLRVAASLVCSAAVVALGPAGVEGRAGQGGTLQRHVVVSVTDADGTPVPALTAQDLIVREDDVAREIISVSPAPPPSHLLLVIDDTGALTPSLIELRAGLQSFVAEMTDLSPPPAIGVMTTADRPTTVLRFTTTEAVIQDAVGRLFPRAQSASHTLDALIEACQAMRQAGADRPVIVAFVIDASPVIGIEVHTTVAQALEEIGASLWTVNLQQAAPPSSLEARERARVVNDVTRWSGGMNRPVVSRQAIDEAFTAVRLAIMNRYDVVYGRPDRLIPPSGLSVEARDPSLRIAAARWLTP
jgi:hypothetical protein